MLTTKEGIAALNADLLIDAVKENAELKQQAEFWRNKALEFASQRDRAMALYEKLDAVVGLVTKR